jgi:hypothetical protein
MIFLTRILSNIGNSVKRLHAAYFENENFIFRKYDLKKLCQDNNPFLLLKKNRISE